MTAIRIAAWVAAQLEKDIAKAQTAQQLAIRMSRARHDGWEKELNRKDKHKRPSQWLMHKRYEKDTAALHKSVCDIYLAMVVAAQAAVEARDAAILAKDVQIWSLQAHVQKSKNARSRPRKARAQK